MDITTLTQAQAAALIGWTARRLRQVEQEGEAIPRVVGENGRLIGYPPQDFGVWLQRHHAKNLGATNDGEIHDEKIERARLLFHQANNESLKEDQNRGELLPAELVIELGAALVGAARVKVLAIHSKIRSRFPALDADVADEVETLSREALSELGSDGLPADIRRRIAPAIRRLESSSGADNKPVG